MSDAAGIGEVASAILVGSVVVAAAITMVSIGLGHIGDELAAIRCRLELVADQLRQSNRKENR